MTKQFGKIIDTETGKTLVEMFGPGRSEDAVSIGLRMLTHRLKLLSPKVDHAGGFFGGQFGYGVEYENDAFMMHPYCWCGKEGECPWCTGCAIYQRTGQCRACSEDFPHTAACYYTEINRAKKAAGLSYILDGKYVHVKTTLGYDEERRIENAIYDKYCAKHGLSREFGAAVHCDCGANDSRKAAIDDRGCDYHFGRGIFARFQPYTLDHERHYYDPPNFWYKPSDFRVKWYKYIGRDNAFNRDMTGTEWQAILGSVLSSIGGPRLEESINEFISAEAAHA